MLSTNTCFQSLIIYHRLEIFSETNLNPNHLRALKIILKHFQFNRTVISSSRAISVILDKLYVCGMVMTWFKINMAAAVTVLQFHVSSSEQLATHVSLAFKFNFLLFIFSFLFCFVLFCFVFVFLFVFFCFVVFGFFAKLLTVLFCFKF